MSCSNAVITVDVKTPPTVKSRDDTCAGFWNAMKHLDLYCTFDTISTDEKLFLYGMRSTVNGDTKEADSILYRLLTFARDTIVKKNARELLILNLTERAEWNHLREIFIQLNEEPTGISRAMYQRTKEEYLLPEAAETLSVQISPLGVPIVDVLVNGKHKKFWLDTGASELVVSSELAVECDLSEIDSSTENITTASTSIRSSMTVIPEVAIGRYVSKNIPAVILENKYLEKKLFGIIEQYSIEGIIGWRLLKNVCLTFALDRHQIVIEKPRQKASERTNFLWLEYPFFLFRTPSGDTAKFFFDSGAEFSSADPGISYRTPQLERSRRFISYQGIGGSRTRIGESIDRMTLFSQNIKITFEDIPVLSIGNPKFVRVDGIIGNDLLSQGTLIMDYCSRHFEFKPFR